MSKKSAARLTIDVSPGFRDALKVEAIAHGKTLKDYVIETLTNHIQSHTSEEEKNWGEMSEKAKKEGILNHEDSQSMLHRMKYA